MTVYMDYKMTAYVGLGSNMGDREAYLKDAVRLLQENDMDVCALSAIYETEPVGFLDQPPFLNMVARIETKLAPIPLLRTLLQVEAMLGRKRIIKNGPRTIDLDLLLYDSVRMNSDELTLPHPRMLERYFVLCPLLDVVEETGLFEEYYPQLASALHRLEQGGEVQGVKRWKSIEWLSEFEPFVNLKD